MFQFYKYIRPEWNFLLPQIKGDITYFPDPTQLPLELKNTIQPDTNYKSIDARQWDIAFQLFHRGFIDLNNDQANKTNNLPYTNNITITDNYYFLFKYFKKRWAYFALFLRLTQLYNPLKELKACWKAHRAKPKQLSTPNISYPQFENIKINHSLLTNHKISIIIATLDRYEYLQDLLLMLEKQTFPIFEIIIIDQSTHFKKNFYEKFNLPLIVQAQKEKGQWIARNQAISIAKGNVFAFCDDDVIIQENWLEEHIKALHFFKADFSAGVFFLKNQQVSPERSFFRYADHFSTLNVVAYRKVFETIGLFDLQYDRMRWGDLDLNVRAYLAGLKGISNPKAYCIDRKVNTGGLRQGGSWDAFQPTNFWGKRPIPSILYYLRKFHHKENALIAILVRVPLSFRPILKQNNSIAKITSILFSILLFPWLLIAVSRSWMKSSKMLRQDSNILQLQTENSNMLVRKQTISVL